MQQKRQMKMRWQIWWKMCVGCLQGGLSKINRLRYSKRVNESLNWITNSSLFHETMLRLTFLHKSLWFIGKNWSISNTIPTLIDRMLRCRPANSMKEVHHLFTNSNFVLALKSQKQECHLLAIDRFMSNWGGSCVDSIPLAEPVPKDSEGYLSVKVIETSHFRQS